VRLGANVREGERRPADHGSRIETASRLASAAQVSRYTEPKMALVSLGPGHTEALA